MKAHTLKAGTIWEGNFLEAPLEPGYTLAILDGPYALGKADWDKMGIEGLADWYAPHLARVSSLLAPSASLYVWNTAEGWARLDPGIRALGWEYGGLIIWDKGLAQVTNYHMRVEDYSRWPDVTEVCGFYQRPRAGDTDDSNEARAFMRAEVAAAGMSHADIRAAIGVAESSGMPGHYLGRVQWSLPTWEAFQMIAAWAQRTGAPRDRPYFVHPSVWSRDVRASWDLLRASYQSLRPFFALGSGVSNVWPASNVTGTERLRHPDGSSLHPCQKPLAFAERMIRASTRPGERVLIPFGGTNREAVVMEWMARTNPEEARRYDACELNADGVDYIGPVLAQIRGEDPRQRAAGQVPMFGRAP